MQVSAPELATSSVDDTVGAVPEEDTACARAQEEGSVVALVYGNLRLGFTCEV